jgi:hypothetical protein
MPRSSAGLPICALLFALPHHGKPHGCADPLAGCTSRIAIVECRLRQEFTWPGSRGTGQTRTWIRFSFAALA